jgi:hypothetical protein
MRRTITKGMLLLLAACSDPNSVQVGPPQAIEIVSGDLQTGPVGQELSQALSVRVIDASGHGVAGQLVTFEVVKGGGSVFVANVTTNYEGVAHNRWTLGSIVTDSQVVQVKAVTSLGTALSSPPFRATPVAGPVSVLEVVTAPSTVQAGSGVSTVSFRARDAFGNVAPGVKLGWGATAGSLDASQTTTDAGGIAAIAWTLPTIVGSYTVTATAPTGVSSTQSIAVMPGPAASLLIESGNNQSAPTGSTLRVVAVVRDAYGNPALQPLLTVTPTSGGGSGSSVGAAEGEGRVSIHLVLGALGTNTFLIAAGNATPVTVTATSLPLPLRVDFVTPAVNEVVPTTVRVAVYVSSSFAIASATATVGASTYAMAKTYPPQTDYWFVEIPVAGIPRGSTSIVVSVTDVNGQVGTATRAFFRDALPTITITSPQPGVLASPTLRIQATCADDDPMGCAKMTLFADGTCGRLCGSTFSFTMNGAAIDTTVTFPVASSDRGWRLIFSGFDSNNQQGSASVLIAVPGSGTAPAPSSAERRLRFR